MAKFINSIEDLQSQNAKRRLMVIAELYYGGNIQDAIDSINKIRIELHGLDTREGMTAPMEAVFQFPNRQ